MPFTFFLLYQYITPSERKYGPNEFKLNSPINKNNELDGTKRPRFTGHFSIKFDHRSSIGTQPTWVMMTLFNTVGIFSSTKRFGL